MPITDIISKIENRQATVGIIGLGYVARPPSSSVGMSEWTLLEDSHGRGLPLALCFVEKGFRTIGFDIDQSKVDSLCAGKWYLKHKL